MRTVLTISALCAGISLLGLLGLLAVSVAPGGEGWHSAIMVAVMVFFVGWVGLALWARGRLRLSSAATLSARARAAVVTCGVIYVFLIFLCSVG